MWVRRDKAFTLIEVMIILAIIVLLAAIIIPRFMQARIKAQTNACVSNLKQVQGAISLWALDNEMNGRDPVKMADLVPVYLKSPPECPLGGDYIFATVSGLPLCPNYEPKGHPAILSLD